MERNAYVPETIEYVPVPNFDYDTIINRREPAPDTWYHEDWIIDESLYVESDSDEDEEESSDSDLDSEYSHSDTDDDNDEMETSNIDNEDEPVCNAESNENDNFDENMQQTEEGNILLKVYFFFKQDLIPYLFR